MSKKIVMQVAVDTSGSVAIVPLFGDDIGKIRPIINEAGSDSAIFDNVLELLHLSGRSLAHVMMMMVPEPWSRDEGMDPARRAFYQYHSCLMEP